ncbi:hypothetical protein OESDEN_10674 [Oesophagostomum dentatum]|uniref:Uncharacterized protein n=1 Tax=Oesophagostomum dentatum TaxID=61180 RepID=A0A0B1SX02_OESDE|nr:hypothetical protein OESDEN_10674 [Oesophagostomum dentatum]
MRRPQQLRKAEPTAHEATTTAEGAETTAHVEEATTAAEEAEPTAHEATTTTEEAETTARPGEETTTAEEAETTEHPEQVVTSASKTSETPISTLSSTSNPVGFSRTLVFLKKDTSWKQHVFIRGGLSHLNRNACSPGPYQQHNDPCAMVIKHITTMPTKCPPSSCHEYRAWSRGDSYLDFEGPEIGQGRYNGTEAFGTPCLWTTSDPSQRGYNPFNKYGYAYWLVELLMDCAKTDNGWFEFKGFIPSIGLELDIKQGECAGDGGSAPFRSKNHVARCGAVNVFYWDSGACEISLLS